MSRPVMTSEPTERVCLRGCKGAEPQPIANFYSRTRNKLGVRLYDSVCKQCYRNAEQERYKNRPLRSSGLGRKGGHMPLRDKLSGYDVTPCPLPGCHLRGHMPGDPDRCAAAQERSTGLGGRGVEWTL